MRNLVYAICEQQAHPLSIFVIRCLCLVSISEISSLWLVSVAEQAGLSLTWSQTPEDRFSRGLADLSTLAVFA